MRIARRTATVHRITWRAIRLLPLLPAILLGALIVTAAQAGGAPSTEVRPAVSIIIDDLGHRLDLDLRTLALPGSVTCAILPRSPHGRRLAGLAHDIGKEVMLHLPMQAMGAHPLDAGGLRVSMSRGQFARTVQEGLQALPHVRGVNNHMGSLLTQYPERMQWLMEELRGHDQDLYFVDSFTTFLSVAHNVARDNDLPTLRRDIFLDASRDPAFISDQFDQLIRHALSGGVAVAIGHPYPETLDFLEANLGRLEAAGIELLSVSALIARKRALDDPLTGVILAADRHGEDNKPRVGLNAGHAN